MTCSCRMSTKDLGGEQSSLLVEAVFLVHDIPFADSFLVRDRTVFRPCPGGAVVTRRYGVYFKKFCPFASFMRTCISVEQQTLANDLLCLFQCRARGVLVQSSSPKYE